MRTAVAHIDLARRTVHWRAEKDGRVGEDPFDRLVLSTGAQATTPPIPGLEHGYPIHAPWEAQALGERLTNVRHAVLACGGYIGLEMAEAFWARGITVVMITNVEQLMPNLDVDIATHVQAALGAAGAEVRLNLGDRP